MLEIVSWDSSVPRVRARWCWMSRTVIPPAYSDTIMSSSPPARRVPLGTSRGSKLPARSRGVSNPMSPTSVARVFGVNPLREFGEPRPAGSPFSYPRCPVSSAASPRSSTALTISGRNPPCPVSVSSPASTRSISTSSSPASIISLIARRAEPGPGGDVTPCGCPSSAAMSL